MTQQYLIGELSLRLADLRAAVGNRPADDVARLQREVESGPVSALAPAAARAIALADVLCWQSLATGDVAAFNRQARVSADLRLFGVCARLMTE
jgi:hypothetical protein